MPALADHRREPGPGEGLARASQHSVRARIQTRRAEFQETWAICNSSLIQIVSPLLSDIPVHDHCPQHKETAGREEVAAVTGEAAPSPAITTRLTAGLVEAMLDAKCLTLLQPLTGKAHLTPKMTQDADSHCFYFVEAERGQPLKTRWRDSSRVTGSGAKAMPFSSRAGM